MSLLEQFREYITTNHLFSLKDRLLLAVSGGLDSVVLTKLCVESGFPFELVHCNFQLREQESERDEEFVRALANTYVVPVHSKRFQTAQYAAENKCSIQVAARELRYAWFETLIREKGNPQDPARLFLVTAHHRDDNIETVLMNYFKGTGVAGMRGMLPKQGYLIRPLLFASRTMLAEFAEIEKLEWVEDSSNALDKYTRNFFRHRVIPLVEEKFPGAIGNIAENIERFRQIEFLYKESIAAHLKKLVEKKEHEIHLPVLKWQKTEGHETILFELLKDFHFTPAQTKEVLQLFESETGKYVQSATHRIFRNRAWLILSPLQPGETSHVLIEQMKTQVKFPGGTLQMEELSADSEKGKMAKEKVLSVSNLPNEKTKKSLSEHTVQLSADDLEFPLLLRKWKTGDYFYPLGLNRKKKISRFLIDQKLSKTEKEKIWVLESNRKIIWVVGMRIDHRFRLQNPTKRILSLRLISGDNMP